MASIPLYRPRWYTHVALAFAAIYAVYFLVAVPLSIFADYEFPFWVRLISEFVRLTILLYFMWVGVGYVLENKRLWAEQEKAE